MNSSSSFVSSFGFILGYFSSIILFVENASSFHKVPEKVAPIEEERSLS